MVTLPNPSVVDASTRRQNFPGPLTGFYTVLPVNPASPTTNAMGAWALPAGVYVRIHACVINVIDLSTSAATCQISIQVSAAWDTMTASGTDLSASPASLTGTDREYAILTREDFGGSILDLIPGSASGFDAGTTPYLRVAKEAAGYAAGIVGGASLIVSFSDHLNATPSND